MALAYSQLSPYLLQQTCHNHGCDKLSLCADRLSMLRGFPAKGSKDIPNIQVEV